MTTGLLRRVRRHASVAGTSPGGVICSALVVLLTAMLLSTSARGLFYTAAGPGPTITTLPAAVTTTSTVTSTSIIGRLADSTSTTSTTMLWLPECGETGLDGKVTATDAFYVLRTAVGAAACFPCICDVDDSGDVTATDALRVLEYAVGIAVVMTCPVCAPAICGDGVINRAGEQCDSGDDSRCPRLCQMDCRCAAPSCGDGIVNRSAEQCDGGDDSPCPGLCQTDCNCPLPSCGNGVRELGELCDGGSLGGQTCISFGFAGGSLACASACHGFDTSACTLPSQPPSDPGTIAPGIDATVSSDMKRATAFLYTGPNRVQFGVTGQTIMAKRAALLRGLVRGKDGAALAGVEIRVLFHPELGATSTRSDGRFDMVVNGGGPLTLVYKKTAYLTVHRQLTVDWQGTAMAPDVVMLVPDAAVTTVDLTSAVPLQVHQASIVSDGAGARQATLMFSQGTGAELVMPDGSRQAVSTLNVRATEYTDDGAGGPEAMPAELPPTSAYTYAFELSADEAIAAGASDVAFDRPVVFYLDNFLQGAAGMSVPVGYYDRAKGQWVASRSGVIVDLVSISGGMADLDSDGDGVAEDAATLSTLGITDAERTQLAGLHAPGDSLWRIEVEHFSPWDANWGWGPPDDAIDPDQDDPFEEEEEQLSDCQDPNGSLLECESQVLGEEIPIAGTEFTLAYRSDRAPGRKSAYTLQIPLTGATVPASMTGVELEVLVAGTRTTYSLGRDHPCLHQSPALAPGSAPGPLLDDRRHAGARATQIVSDITNQSYTFTWNGKDAYGRTMQGPQPVTVKTGFTYCGGYRYTSRFGYNGGGTITGSLTRRMVTLWRTWNGALGVWNALAQRLGGWSLDVHHAYSPAVRTLYLGDGRTRNADAIAATLSTVAGVGCQGGLAPEGVKATEARIGAPSSVAVGPDGSLYIAGDGAIRKVDADGIITTLTGGVAPYDLDVAADGSVYFSEEANRHTLSKIAPDGTVSRVAGVPNYWGGSSSGDGGPALDAYFYGPRGVLAAPDGTVYLSDSWSLRRVDTDGTISAAAQGGNDAIGLAPDGSIYFYQRYGYSSGPSMIKRLGAGGGVSVVKYAFGGNEPGRDFAVDAIGNLYITTFAGTGPVWRLDEDGNLAPVAGGGTGSLSPDGTPSLGASMSGVSGIDIGPDGYLYMAESGNCRIRKSSPALAGLGLGDIVIAAEDGNEAYVFDQNGKHLKTLQTLTGATEYNFTYDVRGLLATITDGNGNQTTVERNGVGNPTGILGPFGQRTTLTTDPAGRLASVTNPAGDQVAMAYTAEGLLTAFTDPRGNSYLYTYDSQGRLVRDDDPAGGYKTLSRTDLANGFEVTKATSLGRITTYRYEKLADGSRRRTVVFPDATSNTATIGNDASIQTTLADGTTLTVKRGPDPRFGLAAPMAAETTAATPAGLTMLVKRSATATLSDPADLFNLATLTETLDVNGDLYTSSYDAASRTLTDTTPEGRSVVTVLDAWGRPTERRVGGLEAVRATYDSRGRLTELSQGSGPDLRRTFYVYDTTNNRLDWTDATAATTIFRYDEADRGVGVTRPDGALGTYARDPSGHVVTVSPPGAGSHRFSYDAVGLLSSYTAPDAGAGNSVTAFTHDTDRSLSSIARPEGGSVDFSYDGSGRVVGVQLSRGQLSYAYDSTTGQLATATAPDGGTVDFGYDGSLVTDTAWSGDVTGTVSFVYDDRWLLTGIDANGSGLVGLSYDRDGLLSAAGNLSISRSAGEGFVTGSTLGNVSTGYAYNGFGERTSHTVTASGTAVYSSDYTVDLLGRVAVATETIGGTTKAFNYAYDPRGRLISVAENGSTVATYAYDANDNRTTATDTGGTRTATYDARDRLLTDGTTSYGYAASGALSSKTDASGTTSYSYDELGNLVSVALADGRTIDYVVDALGRRVGKKVDGVLVQGLLYRDALNPVAELDGSGALVSTFVYATNPNVPDYMVKNGTAYRIVSDFRGSVRLVLDAQSGQIAQRLDYDAYGRVINDTNPGFQPFGFAGGIYDSDTKLSRFGARDYDAVAQRWTDRDPLGFEGTDVNLYAYVGGDPVNRIDPAGTGWLDKLLAQVAKRKADMAKELAEGAKRSVKPKPVPTPPAEPPATTPKPGRPVPKSLRGGRLRDDFFSPLRCFVIIVINPGRIQQEICARHPGFLGCGGRSRGPQIDRGPGPSMQTM